MFFKDNTVNFSRFEEIEGIAVVLSNNRFIIKLSNEQSVSAAASRAIDLYSDILPDKTQAEIISMNYYDINKALKRFGGDPFTEADKYMTKAAYNDNYNYIIDLSSCYGGNLNYGSNGYVRGVKTFTD